MRLERQAVRQIDRVRGDVIDGGLAVIAERLQVGMRAEQPVARRQRGQREPPGQEVGQLLHPCAISLGRTRPGAASSSTAAATATSAAAGRDRGNGTSGALACCGTSAALGCDGA